MGYFGLLAVLTEYSSKSRNLNQHLINQVSPGASAHLVLRFDSYATMVYVNEL